MFTDSTVVPAGTVPRVTLQSVVFPANTTRFPRLYWWAMALILVGAALRVMAFVSARDLWIDEAMLALNLVSRSSAELLEPLDYNQGAPVGFLLAVKASITAFGERDWAFRFVPLLASLFGLFVFVWLARQLLRDGAAILASLLFALSPHLVSYASECKQYASDAAIAVLLFATACGLLQGKGGVARYAILACIGALAVWCSHPSVFILGGIGTALFARAVTGRNRARAFAVCATIAVWLASFAACYFLCLKQLGANRYLTEYWAGQFFTFPPRGIGDCVWVVDRVVAFFALPGGFGGVHLPLAAFATVVAILGLREFARDNWSVAVAFFVPAVLVLVASALQKYPAGGRLLLFFVPVAVLCVARGLWQLVSLLASRDRVCAGLIGCVFVLAIAWECADTIRKPPRAEELNALLKCVRAELNPQDNVYVYYGAIPAYRYYTRNAPLPAAKVTLGTSHRGNLTGYHEELNALNSRVWVIFSHRHADEATAILAILETRGSYDRVLQLPGAAAYRFSLKSRE